MWQARPLRLLLAGAGLFGCEHLDRLARRTDVQVVGVAIRAPTRAVASGSGTPFRRCSPMRLRCWSAFRRTG
jgi:hypothetical protein